MAIGIDDGQIEQMSKALFRFCLSKTGSYHDAEDLAQEIMLVACRTTNHFEPAICPVFCMQWNYYGIIIPSSKKAT